MKTIKFKDFEGMLQSPYNDELVVDESSFEDEYRECFTEESDKSIYAQKVSESFGIDLNYMIECEAENHFREDLVDCLDMKSELLVKAQDLISEWLFQQGDVGDLYSEDKTVLIDLSDLYDECLKELNLQC